MEPPPDDDLINKLFTQLEDGSFKLAVSSCDVLTEILKALYIAAIVVYKEYPSYYNSVVDASEKRKIIPFPHQEVFDLVLHVFQKLFVNQPVVWNRRCLHILSISLEVFSEPRVKIEELIGKYPKHLKKQKMLLSYSYDLAHGPPGVPVFDPSTIEIIRAACTMLQDLAARGTENLPVLVNEQTQNVTPSDIPSTSGSNPVQETNNDVNPDANRKPPPMLPLKKRVALYMASQNISETLPSNEEPPPKKKATVSNQSNGSNAHVALSQSANPQNVEPLPQNPTAPQTMSNSSSELFQHFLRQPELWSNFDFINRMLADRTFQQVAPTQFNQPSSSTSSYPIQMNGFPTGPATMIPHFPPILPPNLNLPSRNSIIPSNPALIQNQLRMMQDAMNLYGMNSSMISRAGGPTTNLSFGTINSTNISNMPQFPITPNALLTNLPTSSNGLINPMRTLNLNMYNGIPNPVQSMNYSLLHPLASVPSIPQTTSTNNMPPQQARMTQSHVNNSQNYSSLHPLASTPNTSQTVSTNNMPPQQARMTQSHVNNSQNYSSLHPLASAPNTSQTVSTNNMPPQRAGMTQNSMSNFHNFLLRHPLPSALSTSQTVPTNNMPPQQARMTQNPVNNSQNYSLLHPLASAPNTSQTVSTNNMPPQQAGMTQNPMSNLQNFILRHPLPSAPSTSQKISTNNMPTQQAGMTQNPMSNLQNFILRHPLPSAPSIPQTISTNNMPPQQARITQNPVNNSQPQISPNSESTSSSNLVPGLNSNNQQLRRQKVKEIDVITLSSDDDSDDEPSQSNEKSVGKLSVKAEPSDQQEIPVNDETRVWDLPEFEEILQRRTENGKPVKKILGNHNYTARNISTLRNQTDFRMPIERAIALTKQEHYLIQLHAEILMRTLSLLRKLVAFGNLRVLDPKNTNIIKLWLQLLVPHASPQTHCVHHQTPNTTIPMGNLQFDTMRLPNNRFNQNNTNNDNNTLPTNSVATTSETANKPKASKAIKRQMEGKASDQSDLKRNKPTTSGGNREPQFEFMPLPPFKFPQKEVTGAQNPCTKSSEGGRITFPAPLPPTPIIFPQNKETEAQSSNSKSSENGKITVQAPLPSPISPRNENTDKSCNKSSENERSKPRLIFRAPLPPLPRRNEETEASTSSSSDGGRVNPRLIMRFPLPPSMLPREPKNSSSKSSKAGSNSSEDGSNKGNDKDLQKK